MHYLPMTTVAAQPHDRFYIFSTFSQKRIPKKVFSAYRDPRYQIKAHTMLIQMQKELFCFEVVLGNTLRRENVKSLMEF